MLETQGNLWDFHAQGHWVCITINGVVKPDGRLVMGAGLAKQALDRHPGLDALWGDVITRRGLGVIFLYPERLIAYPTKHHFRDAADLTLIEVSARELVDMAWGHRGDMTAEQRIFLPPVGCGLGGLKWADVKPVIAPILTDSRFVAVVP